MPVGAYRFRADLNGTQFWSDKANECGVPSCKQVEITVSKPVTVTVLDSASTPKEGLKVYAFDGTRYTGYNGTTNANGQAILTLPEGSYRFRADLNGTQFWSATENSCAIPGCENAAVTVSLPVTVTVLDTDSTPKVGLNVYAFDETTYSGYHLATDANGQVIFTLPQGNYRFRADLNGTQFWSGSMNHCDPNNVCAAPVITVTKPVTVTVLDTVNVLYPNLSVYAFDGTTYTGYHGTTDAKGQVTLTLPQGNYRFRADYNDTQFWSATENNCTLPGCGNTAVTLPGGFIKNEVTIDYTYDPLYRLTTAVYSNGDAYRYAYDSVGNRLMQESMVKGLTSNVDYQYDIANRLADADGVPYVYDNNGNLLNDGVNEYVYDPANRLTTVNSPSSTVSYGYNGLGDRLSQNEVNYTLDLNTGLTQVLSDGTTTYTYGLGRISQQSGSTPEYFLGDALGSVRQLTSQSGAVTYAASYDPYGVVTQSGGASNTEYGFTGEATSGDSTQLIYLRARWYNPSDSRFQSRDTWEGTSKNPMSMNHWNYTQSNPINYTDPSGYIAEKNAKEANEIVYDLSTYNVFISVDWGEIYVGENWDQCWHEGQWTMPDLKAIQAAVHIMDKGVRYLGGDFKKLIGFVKYEPQKGGPDGKGDPANNYLATTTLGQTVWQIANWDSEENRLWVAVHEMGHIVAFNDMPDKVKYFRDELGASCSNGKNYCNTNEDHTLTYKPGSFAGDKNQNMPSSYALIGSYEDFAETWREVVTSAYIRSGDTTYIRQAWLVYNSNYYKLNHDIGRRRKVMNSIINGSWR